jgi:hypothetical protein
VSAYIGRAEVAALVLFSVHVNEVAGVIENYSKYEVHADLYCVALG